MVFSNEDRLFKVSFECNYAWYFVMNKDFFIDNKVDNNLINIKNKGGRFGDIISLI